MKKMLSILSRRSFAASKVRNLVAVFAIMLTAILFTTVTTIGLGTMESLTLTQQLVKGSKSDGDFRYMTAEQFEKLKNADFIEAYGLRMPIGFLTNTVRHNIEFSVEDGVQAELTFHNPSHGTMPVAANEIVASDAALRELGAEPEVGAVVPIRFNAHGKEYSFKMVVAGWYEATNKEVSTMWTGMAFCDANPDIFQNTFRENGEMSGTYFSDFTAKSSFGLQDHMNDWVVGVGGNPHDMSAENYLPAVINRSTNASIDLPTILMGMVIVILFILCGYLLIYNVFDIAVMQEIRRYGLYRTIGMSQKQVRKLIDRQALWLSGIGIPLGLFIGYFVGKLSLPVVMNTISSEYENIAVNVEPSPIIFLGAAVLTALTVFISTRKPVRIAANTPPIEAFRYVETAAGKRKTKRKSADAKLTRMAWSNLGRNKRRSAFIMISLMLSILLFNSVGIASGSVDVEKQVDYVIRSDFAVVNAASTSNLEGFTRREQGLKEKTMEDIAAQPGVYHASAVYKNTLDDRNVTYDFGMDFSEIAEEDGVTAGISKDGYGFNLGNDHKPLCNVYGMSETAISRMDIQEGETDASVLYQQMLEGNGVLVGVDTDRSTMEINKDLDFTEIGDLITVYKDGEALMELPVLAKAALNGDDMEIGYTTNGPVEVGGDGLYLYLPDEVYKHIYDEPTVYKYSFDIEETEQENMSRFLDNYMNTADLSINYMSAKSARQNAEGTRIMITFVGGLLGFIFGIVGVLNLINTIITTIIARRHEFATMQSIGMTKRQLIKMLTFEGLYYAAGSCVIGLLSSVLIGFTIVKGLTGGVWYFTFHFTLLPAVITCIVLLIMAAIIPTVALRLFNKGSIVEQLRVAD